MKRLYFLALAGLTHITILQAQVGGSRTYAFLNLPNSARAEALGGTVVSLYDNDLSLAYNNPSLLHPGMHNQAMVSFNNYFANVGYGYAGYARHWNNIGTFHAGIQYVNYGQMPHTNELGDVLGRFSASDYALTIGYSRSFFDSLLWVGGNYKMLFSQYEIYNSFGMALDAGVTYLSRNKLFTASLVLKNMGGQLKTYSSGNHEPIPFEIQLGTSITFKYVPVRLMMWVTNLQSPDLSYTDPQNRFTVDPLTGDTISNQLNVGLNILRHFVIGAEIFPFKKRLYLRVAYNFMRSGEMGVDIKNAAQGLCYGIGIRISAFNFSFGRAEYHIAGSPNHFSLVVDINKLAGMKGKRKAKGESVPIDAPPPSGP